MKVQQIRRWSGEEVKALRKKYNLPQKLLAKLMGSRQQSISEWETDLRTPSRMSCKFLDDVEEFLEEKVGAHKDDVEAAIEALNKEHGYSTNYKLLIYKLKKEKKHAKV